ncbi:exocyst complex component EXO70B1 [Ricinus communis]|uniref:Exocyst subunit Exo70 family protein n=1 Tax=Ricinus communis TaxID=3988 RepID=B9S3S8_RICCO|nr:exocyst complex component EXO70B1 [Ricinus communis]EEF41743.1 protein binding protein, putative [Ricinus communis]|eukprot:XP_002520647.1 exocyst complex component EXO70B1 [Ricinus communis]
MDDSMSENHPPEKQLSRKYSNTFTGLNSNSIPINSNHDFNPDPDTRTSKKPPCDSPKMEVKLDQESEKPVDIEGAHQDIDDIEKINEIPAPEIHYTLETLFEDIDQFLSTSSSLAQKENKSETKDTVVEEAGPEEKGENDEEDENKVTPTEIPIFIDKFLEIVVEKIAEHESNEGKMKWRQVSENDSSFLEAVNRISKLTNHFTQFKSDPNYCLLVNSIGGIQQRAMSYLEDEFRLLLENYKSNINDEQDHNNEAKGKQQEGDYCTLPETKPESTDQEDNFLGYSDDVVRNLKRIAKEMIEGGFESECCQVYMITRRHAFDDCLNKVGFEKISIDEVQKMQWEALEREIPAWIKTFKDCAFIYFSKERKLAEAVFSDRPSISSFLFSNLVRGVMIQLLNFTEGIAMTNHSAEKLFKLLDMYETLRDSIQAMDGLFPDECENELKTEMITAKCRIGEAAISIFCDLENSIKSDTGKTPVPGGAVHPLTRYTMNYLKYACEYMATLELVFREHAKIERADSTSRTQFEDETQDFDKSNAIESHSPFSVQLMRVMDLLDSNLEAKAKLYKDIALSNIFMMNNGRYILQKIKGSTEIHEVVGDTWCRKKSSDLRNFHKGYQRETWSKILHCLGHEGLQVNGKVQKPVLKERFKSFYMMFDEIHKTQSSWVVSDEQLQSELRVSISALVIPAYRSFMGRFSQYLDPGRQYEKYVKYQPEDIETCIDELFDGNATPVARRRP